MCSWSARPGLPWPCPECGARCPIISRNDNGGIWTLANSKPSCTPRHRDPVARWAEPNSRFTAIQERAVKRVLARRKAQRQHLGVDEKSFTRGHRYFTLVNDPDRGGCCSSLNIARESGLDAFWSGLSQSQLDTARAVAMEMWDPYVNSTRRHRRTPTTNRVRQVPHRHRQASLGNCGPRSSPGSTNR